MVAKRIIVCLDMESGRVVKGTRFQELKDMGDPAELAKRYMEEGIDELVLLDITASYEKRETLWNVVKEVAAVLSIPFTVGGGVSTVDDALRILDCGADKIAINTAAVRNPSLISECARRFGSQAVVVAVDSKRRLELDTVYIEGGRTNTGVLTLDWVKRAFELGAGEILLTEIDHDGVRRGFANELIRSVSRAVSIPVIASGGAGCKDDFVSVFKDGEADAALAAGVFHEGVLTISSLKQRLKDKGIEVRI